MNSWLPVHDRMPVILHPGDFNRWLDRESTEQPPSDLLRPFPADEMEAFEVSVESVLVQRLDPAMDHTGWNDCCHERVCLPDDFLRLI